MTDSDRPLHGHQIEHLCRLARLTLSPAEAKRLSGDLDQILVFVTAINGFLPQETAPESPGANPDQWRSDRIRPGLNRDEALANAAATDGAFFTVPEVIGRQPGPEE